MRWDLLTCSSQLANIVSQYGTIMENHAQWVILQGVLGGDLGILNVYAPNDSQGRYQLWKSLIRKLPTTWRWIIGGDFNTVESCWDKTNPCRRLVLLAKREFFNNLKRHLNIDKNPRSQDNLTYSWDNFKDNGQWIVARLDLFHIWKCEVGWAQHK